MNINKNIIIGIGGGISAYKIPDLTRNLSKIGANVRIIMTNSAKSFVSPLTLQTVSGNPVFFDLLDFNADFYVNHISLAKWADLIVLAPATADLLARLSIGMANDLLTATCLSSKAKIAVVPAMNQQMYSSEITQKNIQILKKRGLLIWGPDIGFQICGDHGPGRMLDILKILDLITGFFYKKKDMKHLTLGITAGPTQEKIDPIRFISNYSSGKMGFSIAKAASLRGAIVTLISGPVHLPTPIYVNRINVFSASEMCDEVQKIIKSQKIFISCAAVSDYKPEFFSLKKIKKKSYKLNISFVKNTDILETVSKLKKRPYIVGFAAETENIEKNAKYKLIRKNIDLICANNVLLKKQGFGSENNALYLFWKDRSKFLPFNSKLEISHSLLDEIIKDYEKKNKY